MDHDFIEYHDLPRYRSVAENGQGELVEALRSLAGFSENAFLVMQAHPLGLVDNLLNALEDEVMRHQAEAPK